MGLMDCGPGYCWLQNGWLYVMGRLQFSTLDDQPTVAWLHWLCLDVPSSYLLWPGSHQAFVGYWMSSVERLGLTRHRFTVGSLRPGGATGLFLRGVEVIRIKFKGKWRSEQSPGLLHSRGRFNFGLESSLGGSKNNPQTFASTHLLLLEYPAPLTMANRLQSFKAEGAWENEEIQTLIRVQASI